MERARILGKRRPIEIETCRKAARGSDPQHFAFIYLGIKKLSREGRKRGERLLNMKKGKAVLVSIWREKKLKTYSRALKIEKVPEGEGKIEEGGEKKRKRGPHRIKRRPTASGRKNRQ